MVWLALKTQNLKSVLIQYNANFIIEKPVNITDDWLIGAWLLINKIEFGLVYWFATFGGISNLQVFTEDIILAYSEADKV